MVFGCAVDYLSVYRLFIDPYDLERRVPDVQKLERLTGFRFSRSLEQVVEEVVADARSRLAAR